MTDDLPVLLLDLDGVLNVLAERPPTTWPTWRRDIADGFPMLWSPDCTAALRDLHDGGQLELQWLTTWFDRIRELAFMSLPDDLAVAGTAEDYAHDGPNTWWKLAVAQRAWATGRPLIWVDDQLGSWGWARSARGWMEGLPEDRALMVTPRSRSGLAPSDVDRIRTFCR